MFYVSGVRLETDGVELRVVLWRWTSLTFPPVERVETRVFIVQITEEHVVVSSVSSCPSSV